MMLGGDHLGTRLNKPFKEQVTEPEILDILTPMIKRYAKERQDGERFGNWTVRTGYVKPTTHGTNFYADSVMA
jgi:sulfite reductase (NADPH) hemoprotein beta-component